MTGRQSTSAEGYDSDATIPNEVEVEIPPALDDVLQDIRQRAYWVTAYFGADEVIRVGVYALTGGASTTWGSSKQAVAEDVASRYGQFWVTKFMLNPLLHPGVGRLLL